MINISTESANEAWRETLKALVNSKQLTDNEKYLRDEIAVIEITNPKLDSADPNFPMLQTDLDVINNYIFTGENEGAVVHEWTKLYYHRIFDEPNPQIKFLIKCLNKNRPIGEAQISMWDKNIDQNQSVSPCTQIIWARIKHGKLELHVHAHSSDAYKKLLMNMLEFISLQHYIARRVGAGIGSYYHFIDSCHLHKKDTEQIKNLIAII